MSSGTAKRHRPTSDKSTITTPTKDSTIEMLDDKDKPYNLNKMQLDNDRMSMILLLVLYTLQGIPMGLCGSIPMILKERNVTFEGLSLFSLVSFPFSLKIIWAPIVDSFYIPKIGRRKTWLIPVQILTGLFMIFGSTHVAYWMGDRPVDEIQYNGDEIKYIINISYLTPYFFTLYFLMATQDIAVDGWALNMLSREYIGYSSLCNSVGQSLGIFFANQGFIALSDPMWCKEFLGFTSDTALVTLHGFIQFWGYVFVVVTILVWFGKNEISSTSTTSNIQTNNTKDLNLLENDLDMFYNDYYNKYDKVFDTPTITTPSTVNSMNSHTYNINGANSNGHTSSSSGFLVHSSGQYHPNFHGYKNTSHNGYTSYSTQSFVVNMYPPYQNPNNQSNTSTNYTNNTVNDGINREDVIYEDSHGFYDTCKQLYKIIKLPLIHTLVVILLTCKVAFAPADSVSLFKLQEYGMPKTELSLISPLLMSIGFIIPMFSGKMTAESPLKVLILGLKLKLGTSFLRWVMVILCQIVYADDILWQRYAFFYSLVCTLLLHEAASTLIFLSFMTFFSKISDANIGGTYMTFLNTISNLGSLWPSSLALYMSSKLTLHTQYGIIDGYTIETFICMIIGLLWLYYFHDKLLRLQASSHKDWLVSVKFNM